MACCYEVVSLTGMRGTLIHCYTNVVTLKYGPVRQTNADRAIGIAENGPQGQPWSILIDMIRSDVCTCPFRVMPSTPPVAVCSVAAMTASFVMRAR